MATVPAFADSEADKPRGFRFFNQHLTIKPYVSLSYSYDSNIETTDKATDDNILMVSPGVDFEWVGDRWSLSGSLWYRYNYYCDYNDQMGENSYGESLTYAWTTSKSDEKGWSAVIAERYAYISQADSITSDEGRGIWRDRQTANVSGAVERRFTERWHAALSAQYDYLDYDNDTGKYAPLYGWQEYSFGLEAGFMLSKWTDLIVAGGYSGYRQDSSTGLSGYHYDNESDVWSIQGGIGSRATEKITYRLLTGASWLSYGGKSNADVGWTYSLSANWRATRQLTFTALGSSYYQPSERQLGQAVKTYAMSVGVSYLTFGDKVNLTGDVAWRKEDQVYSDYVGYGSNYTEDIFSARIGATYTFNRWVSLFANLIYEKDFCDENSAYEYDRFRGTLGIRFHY